MAKPPRSRWVHKPWHKYTTLPRPVYHRINYNEEEFEATPEHFEHKLEGRPPKLWVAWLFRYPGSAYSSQKADIQRLFGEDFNSNINKMKIFKNTPYWNNLLWKAKSFIEIRPITFPHGEPTESDVNFTTLRSSGECIVDKSLKIDEKQLNQKPEDDLTNFPRGYITGKLLAKWYSGKDIQEDDVWSKPNISRW